MSRIPNPSTEREAQRIAGVLLLQGKEAAVKELFEVMKDNELVNWEASVLGARILEISNQLKREGPEPLDINKPGMTYRTIYSAIADVIKDMCESSMIGVPPDLKEFVDTYEGVGHDFHMRLLKASDEMSDELIANWIAALRSSFYRAELRGILKERGSI